MASLSGLSSILTGGDDAIVARATPDGAGALAIVRLSGPDLSGIIAGLCPGLVPAQPRVAQLRSIVGSDGREIERGILIFYPAPHSFSGEDMLEMSVHASPFLVEEIISSAVEAGARRATPGEFSRRAVANGKMDLVQAEAVDQLIRAETAWQAKLAREQLHGELSRKILRLRDKMLSILAATEASLDYVEQGAKVADGEIDGLRRGCLTEMERLLASVNAGRRIRRGARVVILGPVNVGKSSLLNALCKVERAIVNVRPGTTRDPVEVEMDIEGIPVCLVDTAGLRNTGDDVEQEGISRARNAAKNADILLLVKEAGGAVETPAPVGPPHIRVHNKIDLLPAAGIQDTGLGVSALTGEGVEELRAEIHRLVKAPLADLDGGVAMNPRQAEALTAAREHLLFDIAGDRELIAEEVYLALEKLDELLGRIDEEEVLDEIFGAFCLGK